MAKLFPITNSTQEALNSIIPNITAISIMLLSVITIIYIISVIILHRKYNSKIEDEKTHPLLAPILSFIPNLALSVFVIIGYIV